MELSDAALERIKRRVGTVCGAYRLDRLLGIGGMGAVFAATAADGRGVAVKALHAELSRNPQIQTRFFREAYVGNAIAHPGVARVFEHGTDGEGVAFLVMELLDGETLEALWVRRGQRLPEGLVLAITERLLEVLVVAHAVGVVHRDIKPENIFMTSAGELKVLDFGIARLLEGTSATASGEMMGTPAFMPPEQAGGHSKTADARSDLWSVGALMFTLLTGRHVHDTPTQLLQLVHAATKKAPSLSTISPETPHGLVEIVDHALQFDRAARWPSAQAMLERVRAMATESIPPTVAAPDRVPRVLQPAPPPFAARPPVASGPTLPLGEMAIANRAGKAREPSEPK